MKNPTFEEIVKHYKEGMITRSEAVGLLMGLFDLDSDVDNAHNFPDAFKKVANHFKQDMQPERFNSGKWINFFELFLDYVAIIGLERFYKEAIDDSHLNKIMQVLVPKGKTFKVSTSCKAMLVPKFNAPFSDKYEITVEPEVKLVTLDDTYGYNAIVACMPLEYDSFEKKYLKNNYLTDTNYTGYVVEILLNDMFTNTVTADIGNWENILKK